MVKLNKSIFLRIDDSTVVIFYGLDLKYPYCSIMNEYYNFLFMIKVRVPLDLIRLLQLSSTNIKMFRFTI